MIYERIILFIMNITFIGVVVLFFPRFFMLESNGRLELWGLVMLPFFGFCEVVLSLYFSIGLKNYTKWFQRNMIIYWSVAIGFTFFYILTVSNVIRFGGEFNPFYDLLPVAIIIAGLQLINLNRYSFKR